MSAAQFRSVFPYVLRARALAIDIANLVDGAGATQTIAVPGAALGDVVLFSFGVSLAGMSVTAYVSAADVVSVRVQNESAGAVDLASTYVNVFVLKPFIP